MSAATITDRDALKRFAKHRDPAAFALLVLRYQRLVYAACCRRLKNTADAEDATQEVFCRLADHAGQVRSQLSTWLWACATHVSIDRVRHRQSREKAELERARQPMDDAARAEWIESLALLDRAIEALDAEDRDLIVGLYLSGMTQAEYAAAVGISQPTVHRRGAMALRRLRDLMPACGVAPPVVAGLEGALSPFHFPVPGGMLSALDRIGLTPRPPGGAAILWSKKGLLMKLSVFALLTVVIVALAHFAASTRGQSERPQTVPAATSPAVFLAERHRDRASYLFKRSHDLSQQAAGTTLNLTLAELQVREAEDILNAAKAGELSVAEVITLTQPLRERTAALLIAPPQ